MINSGIKDIWLGWVGLCASFRNSNIFVSVDKSTISFHNLYGQPQLIGKVDLSSVTSRRKKLLSYVNHIQRIGYTSLSGSQRKKCLAEKPYKPVKPAIEVILLQERNSLIEKDSPIKTVSFKQNWSHDRATNHSRPF